MKAILKNYRQSPRKVRMVANLVKGKTPAEAVTLLTFTVKRASTPLIQLIASAVANARQQGENPDTLIISALSVNDGVTMHRSMPRARGSASRIHKRSSHVTVVLGKKTPKKTKKRMTATKSAK